MENGYTYEIFDDGYDISKDGVVILTQRDPYGKVFDPDGTYEENAILHIEELTQPAPEPQPTEYEILRGDIDFLALMEDVTLPSKEGE